AAGERGRAGIARGRADYRHMLAAPRQHRIEQQPDELQGKVLEGERRAVEQLQEPEPPVELHQGRDCGMTEIAVGGSAQPVQFGGIERVDDRSAAMLVGENWCILALIPVMGGKIMTIACGGPSPYEPMPPPPGYGPPH